MGVVGAPAGRQIESRVQGNRSIIPQGLTPNHVRALTEYRSAIARKSSESSLDIAVRCSAYNRRSGHVKWRTTHGSMLEQKAKLGAPVLGLCRSRSLAVFARVGLIQVHIISYDPKGW